MLSLFSILFVIPVLTLSYFFVQVAAVRPRSLFAEYRNLASELFECRTLWSDDEGEEGELPVLPWSPHTMSFTMHSDDDMSECELLESQDDESVTSRVVPSGTALVCALDRERHRRSDDRPFPYFSAALMHIPLSMV